MLDGYGSMGDFPKVLPKIPTIIQSVAGMPPGAAGKRSVN
jgi:hypothetical protein